MKNGIILSVLCYSAALFSMKEEDAPKKKSIPTSTAYALLLDDAPKRLVPAMESISISTAYKIFSGERHFTVTREEDDSHEKGILYKVGFKCKGRTTEPKKNVVLVHFFMGEHQENDHSYIPYHFLSVVEGTLAQLIEAVKKEYPKHKYLIVAPMAPGRPLGGTETEIKSDDGKLLTKFGFKYWDWSDRLTPPTHRWYNRDIYYLPLKEDMSDKKPNFKIIPPQCECKQCKAAKK